MKTVYITVVGFGNYFGIKPFPIGTVLLCEKETENAFDSEAIKAQLPAIGTVGYVANSVNTKANGTLSAGRVYEMAGEKFLARVLFTTSTKVIARIVRFDAKNCPAPGGYEADDDEESTGSSTD